MLVGTGELPPLEVAGHGWLLWWDSGHLEGTGDIQRARELCWLRELMEWEGFGLDLDSWGEFF